ncbi:MAG: HAD family hydrolase [Candidatus Omnitrophica bacterium]|nr:HAD family hydrolase [Candidatus Omnitrophota bacterium]
MKIVVFDLDGTLVDSFEDIACAANHALKTFGFSTHSTAAVKAQVGCGLKNLIRNLLPIPDHPLLPQVVDEVKHYYSRHPTDFSCLYPGALEVLEDLGRKDIIRAVLSNKADPLVQQIAANLNLASHLEAIVGHREGHPLKPDPASLLEILESFSLRPSDCLLVGDGRPDFELAEKSGVAFCAATYGIVPQSVWAELGVTRTIDRLPDLLTFLPERR